MIMFGVITFGNSMKISVGGDVIICPQDVFLNGVLYGLILF